MAATPDALSETRRVLSDPLIQIPVSIVIPLLISWLAPKVAHRRRDRLRTEAAEIATLSAKQQLPFAVIEIAHLVLWCAISCLAATIMAFFLLRSHPTPPLTRLVAIVCGLLCGWGLAGASGCLRRIHLAFPPRTP